LTVIGLEADLAGVAGNEAGSELASLILPTNLAGDLTGSAASAVAVAALEEQLANAASVVVYDASGAVDIGLTFLAFDPITAVLETLLEVFAVAFGSDFLGTLIGDLIGNIFGNDYRGVPYGAATIKVVGGQAVDGGDGEDNNGSSEEDAAEQARNAVDTSYNNLVALIGGTAVYNGWWGIAVGSTWQSLAWNNSVSRTSNQMPDGQAAAIDALINILRGTTFTGSGVDPLQTFRLAAGACRRSEQ
jgi:hypothetical protein